MLGGLARWWSLKGGGDGRFLSLICGELELWWEEGGGDQWVGMCFLCCGRVVCLDTFGLGLGLMCFGTGMSTFVLLMGVSR